MNRLCTVVVSLLVLQSVDAVARENVASSHAVKQAPKEQPKAVGPLNAAMRHHAAKQAAKQAAPKSPIAAPVTVQAHKKQAVAAPAQKLEKAEHKACMHDCGWKAHVALGYGVTRDTGITNPDAAYWDAAKEGYDADLGHTQFIQFGVDKQIKHDCQFGCTYQVGVEMNLMSDMHYQKYQTGVQAEVNDVSSNRMRFFDVGHMSMLAHAQAKKEWNSKLGVLAPVVELGFGLGVNRVYNFHTVVYKANIGAEDSGTGAGSVTSVGSDMRTTLGFAWQVGIGLEFKPEHCHDLAVHVGYRYYGGGKIVSPAQIMLNIDQDNAFGQLSTVPKAWEGSIAMHQFVLGLDIAF